MVARAEVEVGAGISRPVDEQGHRRAGRGAGEVGVSRRQGQRLGADQGLAVEAEGTARSDQHVQLRQRRQQGAELGDGCADELFEVVQHQQHRLPGQRGHQVDAVVAGLGRQLQGTAHRRDHLRRGLAGHQRNESAARKGRHRRIGRPVQDFAQRLNDLDRQPRLAAAAGPPQRDQPLRPHQRAHASHRHVGAKQARQVRRQRQCQRCQAGALQHRSGNRRRRFAGRLRCRRAQTLVHRSQTLAFVVDPLVEVAGHELAPVQRLRRLHLAAARQLLESPHVAGQRAGHDAQRQAVGLQHRRAGHAGRLEQALQRRQHLAQPIAADRQFNAGPQQLDQLLARMRALGCQRHAGQKRGHGARREAGDRVHAVAGLDGAQQADLPARLGGLPARTGGSHVLQSVGLGDGLHGPQSMRRTGVATGVASAGTPGPGGFAAGAYRIPYPVLVSQPSE